VIDKIKFFQTKDSDFLWAFLTALKPIIFYSTDILYSQGDHPEEVFFITKGRVKLCYDVSEGEEVPRNIPFNMYVEGSYFGEMEMFLREYKDIGRDGTAIVDSECHLLVIESYSFRKILSQFPEVRQ
jgi:CRP-like cAMP-binding protein